MRNPPRYIARSALAIQRAPLPWHDSKNEDPVGGSMYIPTFARGARCDFVSLDNSLDNYLWYDQDNHEACFINNYSGWHWLINVEAFREGSWYFVDPDGVVITDAPVQTITPTSWSVTEGVPQSKLYGVKYVGSELPESLACRACNAAIRSINL
jgi:hypothetical protein